MMDAVKLDTLKLDAGGVLSVRKCAGTLKSPMKPEHAVYFWKLGKPCTGSLGKAL
jgi:hypothetical protein